ncbi:ABC-type transporter, periplasmic subunit (plasmid) [Pseudonocardia dioxanivorans CB1190]|uniref:ABC-type transporter, periplasmic subunit n=2 Tax=Pseudonocardiaceae TaxID=2070 RepID=F2L717_PSEUX|nr:ABC transporter substrate-binding protein [Pseudonocardia dioxanivorans]AEA28990.1 ABC-type transporter, periplasmic subunit [Pseudonocardia dioxanivorans CB1190]GJF02471.1 ABC transporter substrate-binding protein [Pseudonocardia sp. D17]
MFSPQRMRGTFAVLMLVVALLLAGCGGGEPSDSRATQAGGEPQRGGSVSYLTAFDVKSLDPLRLTVINSQNYEAVRALPIFDALVYADGKTGEAVMQTAESLTSSDNIRWTLTLKPGITFTDGTAYDAEAVKFNWDRLRDPQNAAGSLDTASKIDSITVAGPTTVSVVLKQPNSTFPSFVAGSPLTLIGSPTAIQADATAFGNQPVGAGPFVLKQWVKNGTMTLERNPAYWNAPYPYLDEVEIRTVADAQQRFQTLAAGQADLDLSTPQYLAQAKQTPGVVTRLTDQSGGRLLALNNAKAPFNDVLARKAVASALDYRTLNDIRFQNADLAPGPFFATSSQLFDPALSWPQFDREAAQRMFDEYAAKNGGPLTFTITFDAPDRQSAEAVQSQLAGYRNLVVDIQILDGTAYVAGLPGGDYQMFSLYRPFISPEPSLSDTYQCGSARNYIKYCNPEVDRLLAAGRSTQDPDQRRTIYQDVAKVIIADQPAIIWAQYIQVLNMKDDVQGYTPVTDTCPLFDRMWLAG